jgi:hypothetical protein
MKNIEKSARNLVSIVILSLLVSLIIVSSISLCGSILSDSNFLEILRNNVISILFVMLTIGQIIYYSLVLHFPSEFK